MHYPEVTTQKIRDLIIFQIKILRLVYAHGGKSDLDCELLTFALQDNLVDLDAVFTEMQKRTAQLISANVALESDFEKVPLT